MEVLGGAWLLVSGRVQQARKKIAAGSRSWETMPDGTSIIQAPSGSKDAMLPSTAASGNSSGELECFRRPSPQSKAALADEATGPRRG